MKKLAKSLVLVALASIPWTSHTLSGSQVEPNFELWNKTNKALYFSLGDSKNDPINKPLQALQSDKYFTTRVDMSQPTLLVIADGPIIGQAHAWHYQFTPNKTIYVRMKTEGGKYFFGPQTGPWLGLLGKTERGYSLKNNVTVADIRQRVLSGKVFPQQSSDPVPAQQQEPYVPFSARPLEEPTNPFNIPVPKAPPAPPPPPAYKPAVKPAPIPPAPPRPAWPAQLSDPKPLAPVPGGLAKPTVEQLKQGAAQLKTGQQKQKERINRFEKLTTAQLEAERNRLAIRRSKVALAAAASNTAQNKIEISDLSDDLAAIDTLLAERNVGQQVLEESSNEWQ